MTLLNPFTHSPKDFRPRKGDCFYMNPQRLNYSAAVTSCAYMGATLWAPKDADDFKFFQDWGDTQFQDDLLIGVRRLQENFAYDTTDTSLFHPVQLYEDDSAKQYSNGEVYSDGDGSFAGGSSFSFDYNPMKRWTGQCLYLKYSTGMTPRDDKYCKAEGAFVCRWVEPDCSGAKGAGADYRDWLKNGP